MLLFAFLEEGLVAEFLNTAVIVVGSQGGIAIRQSNLRVGGFICGVHLVDGLNWSCDLGLAFLEDIRQQTIKGVALVLWVHSRCCGTPRSLATLCVLLIANGSA